jgi:hypothetical protein
METETPKMDPNIEENNFRGIPAFCIMFVTVGMTCFISQTTTVGQMYYKSRKPIHAIVLAQAALGIIVTLVTLLASLTDVDCTFVSINLLI